MKTRRTRTLDRSLGEGVYFEKAAYAGAVRRLFAMFIDLLVLILLFVAISVLAYLNMTVAGIMAHQSAMRDGELLKIPQYRL